MPEQSGDIAGAGCANPGLISFGSAWVRFCATRLVKDLR